VFLVINGSFFSLDDEEIVKRRAKSWVLFKDFDVRMIFRIQVRESRGDIKMLHFPHAKKGPLKGHTIVAPSRMIVSHSAQRFIALLFLLCSEVVPRPTV